MTYLRVKPTGRYVSHPKTCGSCLGRGCPEVMLMDDPRTLSTERTIGCSMSVPVRTWESPFVWPKPKGRLRRWIQRIRSLGIV